MGYDNQVRHLSGINISMITSSRVDIEGFYLLKTIGIPFLKNLVNIFMFLNMIKDIFSDRLTRIRNGLRLKSSIVEIQKNRRTQVLSQILLKDDLVQEVI